MPEAQIRVRFVIALAIVVVATRLVGALARKVGQPAVVGKIAAGILLGPSAFVAPAPGVSAVLLPPAFYRMSIASSAFCACSRFSD